MSLGRAEALFAGALRRELVLEPLAGARPREVFARVDDDRRVDDREDAEEDLDFVATVNATLVDLGARELSFRAQSCSRRAERAHFVERHPKSETSVSKS